MRLIEKAWYQNHPLKWLLLPLSALFYVITSFRLWLYRIGIKKQVKHAVPVIVVGNIGVGGNGKTPVVVYLCQILQEQGIKVGVISRGYGGISDHYPLVVDDTVTPQQAGDEPVLIKQRTKADVVVSPNRNESVEKLIDMGAQVIISDDGLQHYKLDRQVELVVVDARRKFGNGWLLPAGPLRERVSRLHQVDQVIVNISGDAGRNDLGINLKQPVVSMDLKPDAFINVKTGERLVIEQFVAQKSNQPLAAIAGIGDPSRFFTTLNSLGLKPKQTVPFADHHQFSAADFKQIETNSHTCIVMTEKDAVKCREFSSDNWWYLAVSAEFNSEHQAQFNQLLSEKLLIKV